MTIEMIGIDVDPAKIISQQDSVAGGGACVPTSFLNALRFGPPSFRETFMALPGNSEAEKLRNLTELQGSAPSEVQRGRRLSEGGGVQLDDIATYCNSLLASSVDFLTGTHFDIATNEEPSAHLHRIHSLLVSSLQQQVPIVAIVRAFAAAERRGEEFKWRGMGQHAVLIVRVPARITHAQGFVCGFIDPGIGELCEGYVYSETSREFQAIKTSVAGYIYNETENKFLPLKGLEERWINDGYLHLVSPSLPLGTENVPWYARTFVTLSHGLGKFGSSRIAVGQEGWLNDPPRSSEKPA